MKETPNTQEMQQLVEKLLSTHKPTRQAALGQALNMRSQQALNAVEEAIKRLTGKQNIEFYRTGGMRISSPQQAYNQILQMARDGQLAADPAFVQSLIPGVAFRNQDLMTELEHINAEALALYQLLGVQMQLSIWVR